MKSTCSVLFFALLSFTSITLTFNDSTSPLEYMSPQGAVDLIICTVAAGTGIGASLVEQQIVTNHCVRRWENRLFTGGHFKSGFAVCLGRNLGAVAILHYLRELVTSKIATLAISPAAHRITFFNSRAFHLAPTIMRQWEAHVNQDNSEILTSITNYWTRWNQRITVQQARV